MELGRLEQVAPRTVWANEARDFTPWLLANAERLAKALGMELELHASEHAVGGLALDLVGRDLATGDVVIVENQLEGTDHSHLGQILAYAAGTDAAAVVWIATSFREEHRQAMDWLNEKTREGLHFFGVQVSVVRIGDSVPAPLFEVVAKPNDWQKVVRSTARAAARGGKSQLYQRFWTGYLQAIQARELPWGSRRTPQPANWMSFPSPIPGTSLNPVFGANSRLRHEVYIDTGDSEANEDLFEHLLERRGEFESAYGRRLEFDELPGAERLG